MVQLGDPNLSLGPGTTDGTFGLAFNIDTFSAGANVNAVHYVTQDIQVGASAFQLKAGDLLLSTQGNVTLTSVSSPPVGFTNNLTVKRWDVFVFRPDTPGDYSAGTFAMLLEAPASTATNIQGISLIEQSTTVGDATLVAGDFLFTRSGGGQDDDVWLFETGDVGAGNTSGTASVLLEGTDTNVGIGTTLSGVELVETMVTIGGQTLGPGTILLSVDAAGPVGSNSLSVTEFDVFALSATQTTLIAGGRKRRGHRIDVLPGRKRCLQHRSRAARRPDPHHGQHGIDLLPRRGW